MEESHVRFQDSDLDELENFDERGRPGERNNNDNKEVTLAQVLEEDIAESGDADGDYAKVFEPENPIMDEPSLHDIKSHSSRDYVPRPMVRRKKRKDRDEKHFVQCGKVKPQHHNPPSKQVTFDWLAGADQGPGSHIDILKSMVYKLSVELGKEQSRKKDTGVTLDDVDDAPWITQLGGLVPLLVAYEEEMKEVKHSRDEMEEVIEKNRARLEELLEDNTEMACQLRDIAATGPVDQEEFRVMRESAALVLEENQLLREAEETMAARLDRVQEEARRRIGSAEEELASLRLENAKLVARNKKLEEETETFDQFETKMRDELSKSVPVEQHNKAVNECQDAFEELKQNYKHETEDKSNKISRLSKELNDIKQSFDQTSSANAQLDMELKLTKKMLNKYEELSISLQDKLLVLTKDRAEAEEMARKCEEEAEAARIETNAMVRLAKQHRAAGRAAEKERSEESLVLGKLQQKIKDIKVSMGGRIKQLEEEHMKCEASKISLKQKLEAELKETKRELEIQEKIAEKCTQDKRRLTVELELAWRAAGQNEAS
eukprot:TRINITY_DN29127_c0_g1_i1.p1 TRINITY_DN29127_c0_g1~~TRINITY_DN29127_c0_g1_i1.p1  ORF type:complete len:585 (+),score=174.99 TRINITY_DN29127_c0_g1_i1:112-1755(+)